MVPTDDLSIFHNDFPTKNGQNFKSFKNCFALLFSGVDA